MPNVSPVGGLSLVIHASINIVVFLYNKTLKTFKISNQNVVADFLDNLNNQKGDTLSRRVFSYAIVLFIAVYIGGSMFSVTLLLATRRFGGTEDTSAKMANVVEPLEAAKANLSTAGTSTEVLIPMNYYGNVASGESTISTPNSMALFMNSITGEMPSSQITYKN